MNRILAQLAFGFLAATFVSAGTPTHEYHVLPPVTKGNLSIFPIVGGPEGSTAHLLTLDEGVRAGLVVVAEEGSLQGLIRPGTTMPRNSRAEVNRLVLVNNSDRPLLLLAGEVVTGGKQDRVIGLDRIVPPKSGPIDLSVFCVEHGRWVASSEHFSSMKSQMAQPSVRMPAMAERSQQAGLGQGGVGGWRHGRGGAAGESVAARNHLLCEGHAESRGGEDGWLHRQRLRWTSARAAQGRRERRGRGHQWPHYLG